jgi:hypothetical protein
MKASVQPDSGHQATCLQVLTLVLQLGHSGHLLFWWANNFIVPAMPRLCFAAQSCSSLAKPWRVP